MSATKTLAAALPALQPEDAGARLLLFGVRQMGRTASTTPAPRTPSSLRSARGSSALWCCCAR
jgi:hypothetical protein